MLLPNFSAGVPARHENATTPTIGPAHHVQNRKHDEHLSPTANSATLVQTNARPRPRGT